MVPTLLESIHSARNTVNAHKQNRNHIPLINTYFITGKFASESEYDVACGVYRTIYSIGSVSMCLSDIKLCNTGTWLLNNKEE